MSDAAPKKKTRANSKATSALERFRSARAHGFLRVSACAPRVTLADPDANAAEILRFATQAHGAGVDVALFPELSVSGYALDDLHRQSALLAAVERALETLRHGSETLAPLLLVGAPLRRGGELYNCAVALQAGRILGVVPKSYLPNYREFYEARQFTPGAPERNGEILLHGGPDPITAPFGVDLLFGHGDHPDAVLHVEICEDLWAPTPPHTRAALHGATVLLNLSASNALIGKSEHRHVLVGASSSRALAAYVYAAAGAGESTTDLAWDGQAMIYEAGSLLAEAPRFAETPELLVSDIDVERLALERLGTNSFGEAARRDAGPPFRRISFARPEGAPEAPGLRRAVSRYPYVPSDADRLDALCYEAFNIQVEGLRQRLEASGIRRAVIGVSGGLDSTHALLVACRAFDRLGLPRRDILGYSLPGFATSARTRANAKQLMEALGVAADEIDIRPASAQMLRDIGHPAADGTAQYDIAYENAQAGARTSLLFRLANHHGGLVLGTGDLSEAALGWCTYGVGDHMSHYNVNCSAPKTLIQHLIRWCAATGAAGDGARAVLLDILDTEISPELIPGHVDSARDGGNAGEAEPAQRTEDIIGPYALHDFFL
ncbi:MAG: NAD(+) synthase, partial [Pseudomonadota bacterium]